MVEHLLLTAGCGKGNLIDCAPTKGVSTYGTANQLAIHQPLTTATRRYFPVLRVPAVASDPCSEVVRTLLWIGSFKRPKPSTLRPVASTHVVQAYLPIYLVTHGISGNFVPPPPSYCRHSRRGVHCYRPGGAVGWSAGFAGTGIPRHFGRPSYAVVTPFLTS